MCDEDEVRWKENTCVRAGFYKQAKRWDMGQQNRDGVTPLETQSAWGTAGTPTAADGVGHASWRRRAKIVVV